MPPGRTRTLDFVTIVVSFALIRRLPSKRECQNEMPPAWPMRTKGNRTRCFSRNFCDQVFDFPI
jgi:hypothetical protein